MNFKHIPVGLVYKKNNVRDEPEDELLDLQASIDRFDIIQPILVRAVGGRFEIISGHRRFMALKLHGDPLIPCVIRDDIDEADRIYVQIVENTQRKQMSAFELVEAFNRLKKETPGLTNAGIALKIGRSISWVANQYGAAAYADKMVGVSELKTKTAGQIIAHKKKIEGTRKENKKLKLKMYITGNSIQISSTEKEVRERIIQIIESEFPFQS